MSGPAIALRREAETAWTPLYGVLGRTIGSRGGIFLLWCIAGITGKTRAGLIRSWMAFCKNPVRLLRGHPWHSQGWKMTGNVRQ